MINLAGVRNADEAILDELYLAGIPAEKVATKDNQEVPYTYVGKIGNWIFTRRWCYWSASVDEQTLGLPLEAALALYHRKHPTKEAILGDIIRAGGHAGGISPDDYVAQPVYNEELDRQLELLGYKKEYNDFLKKAYIPISCGDVARLCNEGKLTVPRYVDTYHIDTQIGLNEFAKTLFALKSATVDIPAEPGVFPRLCNAIWNDVELKNTTKGWEDVVGGLKDLCEHTDMKQKFDIKLVTDAIELSTGRLKKRLQFFYNELEILRLKKEISAESNEKANQAPCAS